MISPGFFYSLIFHVVKQAEGQKMAQNDKKVHLLCIIFLESYIISSFMVHMCKRIRSWGIFFIFSKFWFSGSLGGQIMLHSFSQKSYIIWLLFMLHMCTMIISPVIFFNFSKLWFLGLSRGGGGGGLGVRNGPKLQKSLSISLCISGTTHLMIVIMLHMCKMMTSLGIFPYF